MGKKNKGPKDPWKGLSDDFRNAVMQGSIEEIRGKLADVALAQQELTERMDLDEDYQQAKSALKVASEQYRDERKVHKLKIKFCKVTLESRGQA